MDILQAWGITVDAGRGRVNVDWTPLEWGEGGVGGTAMRERHCGVRQGWPRNLEGNCSGDGAMLGIR